MHAQKKTWEILFPISFPDLLTAGRLQEIPFEILSKNYFQIFARFLLSPVASAGWRFLARGGRMDMLDLMGVLIVLTALVRLILA